MTKICTTIEQSKKLMELGLDYKTSDMYYWCGSDLRIGGHRAQDIDFDVSAWSLSALLKLMPTLDYRNPVLAKDIYNDSWRCLYHSTATQGLIDTQNYDEPLDAAFEMVIWLLENNKLKRE